MLVWPPGVASTSRRAMAVFLPASISFCAKATNWWSMEEMNMAHGGEESMPINLVDGIVERPSFVRPNMPP